MSIGPGKPALCACGTFCQTRYWCTTCKARRRSAKSARVKPEMCVTCGERGTHAHGLCHRCYQVAYYGLVKHGSSEIDVEAYMASESHVKSLICCMCDAKHWAKGFCNYHYQQYRYYTVRRDKRFKEKGWKNKRPWQEEPKFPKNPKPRKAKGVDKRDLLGNSFPADDLWDFVQRELSINKEKSNGPVG